MLSLAALTVLSALKCLADFTGGLPLEVWKSSVVLDHIQNNKNNEGNSFETLRSIVRTQGVLSLWGGLGPRMVEGKS